MSEALGHCSDEYYWRVNKEINHPVFKSGFKWGDNIEQGGENNIFNSCSLVYVIHLCTEWHGGLRKNTLVHHALFQNICGEGAD